MLGPYYWVPTSNGWDLDVFPEDLYPDLMHDQVWRRSVVPKLAEEWSLSPDKILAVKKIPYSVPRGRVSKEYDGPHYYLSHGDDSPVPDGLSKVIREMNLSGVRSADRLKIEFDSHEVMISQHTKSLLGTIPKLKSLFKDSREGGF
jgi:hypothetical protein